MRAACVAINALPVNSQADLDELAHGLKAATVRVKFLEESTQARTRPLLVEVEEIRDESRECREAWKALKQAVNDRTVRYHQEQRAAEARARALAMATQEQAHRAATAGQYQHAAALQHGAFQAMSVAPVAMTVPGTHTRRQWRTRVVDPARVPRHWCVPDEALISAEAGRALPKASDVNGVLPADVRAAWLALGVEIYLQETAVAR